MTPLWALRIREHRQRFGLSQRELAEELRALGRRRDANSVEPGVDRGAVSKWERGQKQPSAYYRRLLEELFGATPAELGFREALPGEIRPDPVASLPDTDDEDVRRRTFLALLGATALEPLESIRRSSTDLGEPRVDLDEWERTAYAFSTELSATPPRRLVGHLLADYAELARLGPQISDAERRRLARVTGQLAVLIAHSLVSLDEHQAARRWWRTARAAADQAGDPTLAAFVRGQQAMLALYGAYTPAHVIDLVDEAQAVARGMACGGLAEALGARAQALAVMGQAKQAGQALGDLFGLAERLPDDVIQENRSFFGWPEHRLHHMASYTHTHVGDSRQAEQAQERALQLYAPTRWRGPAQIRLHRAACLVADGDVTEGVDYAAGVLQGLPEEHRQDGLVMPIARSVLDPLPEGANRLPAVREYREMLDQPGGSVI